MVSELLVIVLAIAVAVAIVWLFKRLAYIVLNAITGLVTLFLVNQFQLMSYLGAANIGITPATVLVCAFGGIPGAIVLVLLSLAGQPI
ncbi:MAG TPA: pro-sigmaK processing inhibitor BofA family protein [Methanomicrobiales archaeon]|nr:pro-sigmaK processing inhibitor BofA family protein [Methanomicrobiales archaeon]